MVCVIWSDSRTTPFEAKTTTGQRREFSWPKSVFGILLCLSSAEIDNGGELWTESTWTDVWTTESGRRGPRINTKLSLNGPQQMVILAIVHTT